MKVEIGWKRLSISLFLILVAVSSYSAYHNVFGAPSGQIGSIEGGGFCQGDYTVYNNTIDNKLYGMRCSTGVNDCGASTDAGALLSSCVFTNLAAGGLVSLRAGYYATVTPIILGKGGITLAGANQCSTADTLCSVGTEFVAKTNGMIMIEATSGHTTQLRQLYLHDFSVNGNCLAAEAVDLSMTESAILNRLARISTWPGTGACNFTGTAAINLNGDEDTSMQDIVNYNNINGQLDVSWSVPAGNAEIIGGDYNIIAINCQTCQIQEATFQQIKLLGSSGTNGQQAVYLAADYIGNPFASGRINLNGFNIGALKVTGDFIGVDSSRPWFLGTGTVYNANYDANTWSSSGAPNWNSGGATLTKQNTAGSNHFSNLSNCVAGACFTNFPFTIDANGNF